MGDETLVLIPQVLLAEHPLWGPLALLLQEECLLPEFPLHGLVAW